MATKKDIKRLLSQGLTGKEAARLLLQNFVEVDHHRPAILSVAEVQQIRSRVRELSQTDIDEFNAWMRTYQTVGYTLLEARAQALEILLTLKRQEALVTDYSMYHLLQMKQSRRPMIVTEKQYEDLVASQREHKLQQLYCLNEVICYRIGALVDEPGALPGAFSSYYNFRDAHLHELKADEEWEFDEEFTRVYQQAAAEIQELIDSGALEPVRAITLDVAVERADIPRGSQLRAYWGSYEQGFPEGTPEEEKERQLTTYFSGEQLYQAGLAEWQEEIDTFDPCRCEAPYGVEVSGLAVLKHPGSSSQIDKETGYYSPPEDIAESLTGISAVTESLGQEGRSPKEILQQVHRALRKRLRVFLAWQPVLEAASELIGVNLTEDLQTWYAEIVEAVEGYQELLSAGVIQPLEPDVRRSLNQEELERHLELPAFTIDDLKPAPQEIQHLRERIALTLGEGWETVHDEWMKRQTQLIDEEEDSQAEEVEPCGQDAEE